MYNPFSFITDIYMFITNDFRHFFYLPLRGSSQSLTVSPNRLNIITDTKIANPGASVTQGCVVSRFLVSLIILPHSATGGFAPSPRKDRPASSIIIVPISSIAVTRMGPVILGSICLKISFQVPQPDSFAARRYTVSFCARVSLLATLAYFGT